MKHMIRSYLIFTSFWYRVILFAVLPVLLLGLQAVVAVRTGGTCIPVFVPIVIGAEVLADYLFLGGIQEKGSEKLDYLKTSPRGMRVMRSVLIVDQVRRIIYCALLFGLAQGMSLLLGLRESVAELMNLPTFVFAVLLTYDLSLLGIFVSRFSSLLWLNLLCAYVGMVIGIVVFLAVGMGAPVLAAPLCIALGIFGIGFSVLGVKIPMLKVEGSYYDK